MDNTFKTEVLRKHHSNAARVTKVTTPHGTFTTPAFMPVGTYAVVNTLSPKDLQETGSEIILGGNTYHMLVAPGMDVIRSAGGMHQFMAWDRPMLTDSGGFQIFSLSKNAKNCKIDDNGARFKHPKTGQVIHMSPEVSINTQKIIGADIIMAFDQCTPDVAERAVILQAMQRTHQWLKISKEIHERDPHSAYGFRQALFGIIQGGYERDLREQSTDVVLSMDLDGIAIGGETIGYDMQKTREIIHWIRDKLPENQTRYTMGVGLSPQNLLDVVAEGIDIFDCVAPTRNARHGALYHGHIVPEGNWLRFDSEYQNQRISIGNSRFTQDERPILENCRCTTCQQYSRAYLQHLFKHRAIAYHNLACIHNIHVMQQVCQAMKATILK